MELVCEVCGPRWCPGWAERCFSCSELGFTKLRGLSTGIASGEDALLAVWAWERDAGIVACDRSLWLLLAAARLLGGEPRGRVLLARRCDDFAESTPPGPGSLLRLVAGGWEPVPPPVPRFWDGYLEEVRRAAQVLGIELGEEPRPAPAGRVTMVCIGSVALRCVEYVEVLRIAGYVVELRILATSEGEARVLRSRGIEPEIVAPIHRLAEVIEQRSRIVVATSSASEYGKLRRCGIEALLGASELRRAVSKLLAEAPTLA